MEPTLPEGLLPELPGITRGIDTTLGGMGNIGVKPQKYLGARWQQKSHPNVISVLTLCDIQAFAIFNIQVNIL